MFRSVLVIILVIVILWLARTVMQRLKQSEPEKKIKPRSNDTVQCVQCKTYIPAEEAIQKNGYNFCSQQHLEDWKNKS